MYPQGDLHIQQENLTDRGTLQITVLAKESNWPISGAKVSVSYTGDPTSQVETVVTDSSGQTPILTLPAPPFLYSQSPDQEEQPYAEYTIRVEAENYEPEEIAGAEILPETQARQTVLLRSRADTTEDFARIVIPPHTLFGDYPAKIREPETKPVNESGEIVLSRVVVPEYVVVHDGSPRDTTAINYYVRYKDYIKNVASSEIYATWEDNAIRANVLAIMSFTLNRVYTEWYRNKGYDFTITSSTAYDQKWINGRDIFKKISDIVDDVFSAYLSRPNVRQPILTQYCDGRRVICPDWLSQWGSQDLARQGYSTIEILRYYYGDSIYINTAEEISGIPYSWPGSDLTIGSRGQKVTQLQEQLNRIGRSYPAVPQIAVDGIYGSATANAVKKFQQVFGLPATGTTDYATWFKISEIYVGVSKIAELQ